MVSGVHPRHFQRPACYQLHPCCADADNALAHAHATNTNSLYIPYRLAPYTYGRIQRCCRLTRKLPYASTFSRQTRDSFSGHVLAAPLFLRNSFRASAATHTPPLLAAVTAVPRYRCLRYCRGSAPVLCHSAYWRICLPLLLPSRHASSRIKTRGRRSRVLNTWFCIACTALRFISRELYRRTTFHSASQRQRVRGTPAQRRTGHLLLLAADIATALRRPALCYWHSST